MLIFYNNLYKIGNLMLRILIGIITVMIALPAFAMVCSKEARYDVSVGANFTTEATSLAEARVKLDNKIKAMEDFVQQNHYKVWLKSVTYNVLYANTKIILNGEAKYGMKSDTKDSALKTVQLLNKQKIMPNIKINNYIPNPIEDPCPTINPCLGFQQNLCSMKKPVIYLYPIVTGKVKVKLDYKGELDTTYPAYDPIIKGWSATAKPDGTLVNDADGKEYSYLFWEGKSYDFPIDTSEGFIVKGSDTAQFLQKTLKKLGLTPKEYNEFIVYWLPKMQNNPYNFIRFAGHEYTDTAPLTVTPKPDSMLRVFMIYRPLQKPVGVKEQVLPSFHRHGFAVIEWGGTQISQ